MLIIHPKIIINLLVVIPHVLGFGRNKTRIQTIKFYIDHFFESLLDKFVLFVKFHILTAFTRWPTIFNLLSTEHHKLEVISQKAETFYSTRFDIYIATSHLLKVAKYTLEVNNN